MFAGQRLGQGGLGGLGNGVHIVSACSIRMLSAQTAVPPWLLCGDERLHFQRGPVLVPSHHLHPAASHHEATLC